MAVTSTRVLIALRAVCLPIAFGSAAIGIAYAVRSVVAPDVWWPSGGALASGDFVAFPLPLRLVGAAWVLLWSLTVAALAFAVADLARRIRLGVRFDRAVSRSAWALAGILAGGSIVAQVVQNLATTSSLVFDDGTEPGDVTAPITWGISAATFTPNLPLLGVSVIIAVLAYIVGAGEGLQRDTEGLV